MNKIDKMLLRNFDDLYKSCKRVSMRYGLKCVNIEYLTKAIDILKSNKIDPKRKVAHSIQLAYFNVLDELLKVCKEQAKKIGSDGVSFKYLKNVIKTIKYSYKRSIA